MKKGMLKDSITYTTSALVDRIKIIMQSFKTKGYPYSGQYYYEQIDSGLVFNKTIFILKESIPIEIQDALNKLNKKDFEDVITRTIKQIAALKFGYATTEDMVKENRLHWRFI